MKATNPRHGSMQFWPRKRANKENVRVKAWAKVNDSKLLGFAGYKAGMTQVRYTDGKKTSPTKGLDIVKPVTIIECPPLKVLGARAYKKTFYNTKVVAESFSDGEKTLLKTLNTISRKQKLPLIDAVDASELKSVVLVCYTQPAATGIGKKSPEVFEVAIGGSIEDQIKFAKDNLGKEIAVSDVFETGHMVDIHAVTTGKGYQGVIKRFGVALRESKSEKGQRRVGARSGGWTSQAHMMYRVAQPGQQGYHTRTEYNKTVMLIDDNVDKINPVGGIPRFGNVKSTFVLLSGSIPGPKKRLIRFNRAIRSNVDKVDVPELNYISVESLQG